MTLNHLTYIFKHFVNNKDAYSNLKSINSVGRVSDHHSEGSRFESCMQTRHLEKALTAMKQHRVYWPKLPIGQLKCLALPGDTQVGEESSLLSCQAGYPVREFKSLSLGQHRLIRCKQKSADSNYQNEDMSVKHKTCFMRFVTTERCLQQRQDMHQLNRQSN